MCSCEVPTQGARARCQTSGLYLLGGRGKVGGAGPLKDRRPRVAPVNLARAPTCPPGLGIHRCQASFRRQSLRLCGCLRAAPDEPRPGRKGPKTGEAPVADAAGASSIIVLVWMWRLGALQVL